MCARQEGRDVIVIRDRIVAPPEKKDAATADNIVCYIAVGFELPVRADRSSNDKKGECCCCDWKNNFFSHPIPKLSGPVRRCRAIRSEKKTESRRRLARSRIHVALAHTQLVRVIVVVVVRLRLLSQAAQVLLFLDGCQVRSLRRQTKRGLAQYRYRFRNGRRLVFSFGRRRAGRRNYVFFSFLLRPFFLISFLLLLASYLFLCAFPGHQNLLI